MTSPHFLLITYAFFPTNKLATCAVDLRQKNPWSSGAQTGGPVSYPLVIDVGITSKPNRSLFDFCDGRLKTPEQVTAVTTLS